MKLSFYAHAVPASTFDALKDAMPWLYHKSGGIEWIKFDGDNYYIHIFKERP